MEREWIDCIEIAREREELRGLHTLGEREEKTEEREGWREREYEVSTYTCHLFSGSIIDDMAC